MDVDLKKDLHDQVLVEREDFALFVRFEYEKLPPFCSFCLYIGHSSAACKKQVKDTPDDQNRIQKNKSARRVNSVFVPKQNGDKDVVNVPRNDE